MNRFLQIAIVFVAACGGGAASSGGGTTPTGDVDLGTISLENTSNYDIYSIQLSPSDETSWGPNLIGNDALMHGETAKVAVFDCKQYDLRMVDDESVECVIQDIDLCFSDKAWKIDDAVLASCATGWAD